MQRLRVGSCLNVAADTALILRLHEFELLPEEERQRAVSMIESLAVDTPDANFLDESYQSLFRQDEFEDILAKVRADLLPKLDDVIWEWRSNFSAGDGDPEDHFYDLGCALKDYREAFSNGT